MPASSRHHAETRDDDALAHEAGPQTRVPERRSFAIVALLLLGVIVLWPPRLKSSVGLVAAPTSPTASAVVSVADPTTALTVGIVALDGDAGTGPAPLPHAPLRAARPEGDMNASRRIAGARARADADDPNLLVRARAALDSDDLLTAATLAAEHGRRFPHGQSAPEREGLWRVVCALYREAHAETVSELENRCAGRPRAAP
jgi:hypothetical protein